MDGNWAIVSLVRESLMGRKLLGKGFSRYRGHWL